MCGNVWRSETIVYRMKMQCNVGEVMPMGCLFMLPNSKIYIPSEVEKILKGSLDSLPSPSPSVKIQIMGGKVRLRCKGKTLLAVVNKLLKTKSLST